MKSFIAHNILLISIVVLRSLFEGKISRRAQYAMWLFVPLYIALSLFVVIPVAKTGVPSSRVDAYNAPVVSSSTSLGYNQDIANMYLDRTQQTEEAGNIVVPESSKNNTQDFAQTEDVQVVKNNQKTVAHKVDFLKISYVTGTIIVGNIIVVNNLVFAWKILRRRKFLAKTSYGNLNVYTLDGIDSPFLFGRSIYVPSGMEQGSSQYEYSLCHEYCHYKQGDSIWHALKYALLVALWFDPLVWIAFVIVERDSEMAADEGVIELLGKSAKNEYSTMLLDMATNSRFTLLATTSMNGKSKSFLKIRVESIMHGTKRSVAALLATIMLLSSLVGCSLLKFDSKSSKVEATDDWFSYEAFNMLDIYPDYNDGNNVFTYSWALGKYNSEFFQAVEITSNDGSIRETLIDFFNSDGQNTRTINLAPLIKQYEFSYFVEEVIREGNNLRIMTWDKAYFYNLDSGDFECCEGDFVVEGTNEDYGFETNGVTKHYLNLSGKDVKFMFIYDIANYYVIHITDEYGNNQEIDLRNAIDGSPYFDIGTVFPYDDNNVIFVTTGSVSHYFRLDVTTGEVSELSGEDSEFLTDYYFTSLTYLNESNEVIGVNPTGFYKIDFESKTIEKIFDWNWCTFDRALIESPRILEYSNDKIVVVDSANNSCNSYCLTLTREASNPNAGKTILTIDGTAYSAYVSKFNETDDEYFIEIDNRYAIEGFLPQLDVGNDVNSAHTQYLIAEQNLSYQEAVDLMAGDSPDIITNAFRSSQLLSSDLLYDVSELMREDSEYDENLYFVNVMEASKVNDKLLYVPLTFSISAIGNMNSDYSDVEGLTFDEYREFVSSVCNGRDPIAYQRFHFMETLMPSVMAYCLNDEGKVNFDNAAFRELAEYANNDFRQRQQEFGYHEFMAANSLIIQSIGDYLTYVSYECWDYHDVNLIAYPSYAGSGLALEVDSSISISANCSDPEGCYRFVKFMMLAESMLDLGMPGYYGSRGLTTLNREAFDVIQSASLECYNAECDYYNTMREEEGVSMLEMPEIYAGPEMIDYYRSIIERCSYVNYADPSINLIVYEEMQAYFAGDKTLDEVILIMNDRAQTVLNERG